MFRKNFFWIALFWMVIITVLSLISNDNIPKIQIPHIDKLVHFVFYFFFTISWYLSFRESGSNKFYKRVLFFAFMAAVFYGILIEICQMLYTVNRIADINDVIANTMGSLFAVILVSFYHLRRKK